jgi:beta-lactamase regulating signal transducer with metallopeptidase domain
MPFILLYMIKLSVCLIVVFLFYYFVLRRLTFYNWNRYYLLAYTLLSFYIPVVDISEMLRQHNLQSATIIEWVPAVENYQAIKNMQSGSLITINNILLLVFIAGMLIMLGRLCVQLISFRKLKKQALAVYNNKTKLYHVDADIIPFSFGNSIFINRELHNETELNEIIRHEFVHVKQKHSVDIILGELLCLVNWYNPFAWLLKKAIRQNLEFIADDKVLENGISKPAYQYLLLKVTGNNQFSIATQFNFSSLKKRIAMMNKMKSAKVHLVKFLFLLPMLAVLLLAFRNQWQGASVPPEPKEQKVSIAGVVDDAATRQPLTKAKEVVETMPVKTSNIIRDTVPGITEPNDKGYFIDVINNKGNCTVVVKDKDRKEVKRVLLTEWNNKENYYEGLYGEVPPPPPPPAPPAAPLPPLPALQAGTPVAPLPPLPPVAAVPPAPPVPPALPRNVKSLNINNNKATVTLKNGTEENYNLDIPEEKQAFEKKYRPLKNKEGSAEL